MTAQDDLAKIRAIATDARVGFLENTIRLDHRQLINQLETLGEERNEDESLEGRISTERCIAVLIAIGRFKFPTTFDAAAREYFVGGTEPINPTAEEWREAETAADQAHADFNAEVDKQLCQHRDDGRGVCADCGKPL